MYFNTKSFSVFIGLSSFTYGGSDPNNISDACEAEVVLQASQEGFLKYVLINCIDADVIQHINYSGEATLSPSVCLNAWIEDHQTGSPIPNFGDCRTTYQNFVNYVAQYWKADAAHEVFGTGHCEYDQSSGLLTINNSCVENVINYRCPLGRLDIFFNEAGHHLGGQQCSAVTLRKWAIADAYGNLLVQAAASMDYTDNLVATVINDGGDGLCYDCYRTFAKSVMSGMSNDSLLQGHTLAADCAADPTADACAGSTVVKNALAAFKVCSGGFDMQFVGPVCSQTEIDAVQALIPVPYYTLTFCAYNPNFKFCESIQSYLNGIERFSDSSCVLCYQDFFNTMLDNSAIPANVAKCADSDIGVWDANCIAIAGPALQAFHACSGSTLSITEPTVAPPVVITTTETPIVTVAPDTTTQAPEDTTTAAPEETSTTVEPTTTKSISSLSFSLAAVMFVLATYIL